MDEQRLRVLIVEDTVVYRKILSGVVESMAEAVVVGTAPHGRLAISKLEQTPTDLVLLDVEMPEMDGLETLMEIRKTHPDVSVVMISGSTTSSAETTLRCLELGALDFLWKPSGSDIDANRSELKSKLRPLMRHVQTRINLQLGTSRSFTPAPMTGSMAHDPIPVPPRPAAPDQSAKLVHRLAPLPARIDVVGIGVSTGGPNALLEVIPRLPADFPVPILLVQHMPPLFTESLAEHLNQRSAVTVQEARDGEPILPGHVLIAPGGKHMVVRRRTAGVESALFAGLNETPPENSCRPSVDVLFRSMASQYEGNMLAVIMTGMGCDGCEGVLAMKRRGCLCLSQTESTCIVYGMPLAVDEAGLSDEKVPLERLAERIAYHVSGSHGA